MGLWDVGSNLLQSVPVSNPRTLFTALSVITDAFRVTCHRHRLPSKAICLGVLGTPCRTQLTVLPESFHLTFLVPYDPQRHREFVVI